MPTTGERFERAVGIMERLRAPGGWDGFEIAAAIRTKTLVRAVEAKYCHAVTHGVFDYKTAPASPRP